MSSNPYVENYKAFIKRMQGELDSMRYDLELAKGCNDYADAQFYLKRADARIEIIRSYYEECKSFGLKSKEI